MSNGSPVPLKSPIALVVPPSKVMVFFITNDQSLSGTGIRFGPLGVALKESIFELIIIHHLSTGYLLILLLRVVLLLVVLDLLRLGFS